MQEGWKCLFLPDFLQNAPALAGESSAIHGSQTQRPKPQFSLEPRSHLLQHTFTERSCPAPRLLPVLMGNNIYFHQWRHI